MKDPRSQTFSNDFSSFLNSNQPHTKDLPPEQASLIYDEYFARQLPTYMSAPLSYPQQEISEGSAIFQDFADRQLYGEDEFAHNAPQQDFSFFPGGWPSYAGSNYAAAFMPATAPASAGYQSASQPARFHQRAASSSSVASFPDSPYSQASSLHYPQTGGRPSAQYLISSFDGGYGGFIPSAAASPSQQQTHLPTPSNTPIRSTFNMNSRRTKSPQKTASARAAAQSMFQGSSGNGSTKPTGNSDPRSISQYSATGQDWLGTPRSSHDGEDVDAAQLLTATRHVPKFDRTFSDMCGDEFYNPQQLPVGAAAAVSAATRPTSQKPQHLSPHSDALSVRLNDANQARSSPLQDPMQQARIQTAAGLRQQSKFESDIRAFEQHHLRHNQAQPETISPQDAFPEQVMQEEEHMPSLFPSSSRQSNGESALYTTNEWTHPQSNAAALSYSTPSVVTTAPGGESTASTAAPQFGPYIGTTNSHGNGMNSMHDFPARLYSMESTKSDDHESSSQGDNSVPDVSIERPADTSAGRGTYSCTYHGCTRRFGSATLLQKHKRDDHRSTGAGNLISHSQSPDPQTMSQAGPHKCARINPSTGKPCNAIFSRPYDLTRHEDTIHAERKKVRCPHCTEEKTFSRADALTRHLRVVHPQIRFPGKHSRRRLE